MEDTFEYGIWPVTLEIRESGREIWGSLTYNSTATRGDRGSVRKERFDRGAFDFAIHNSDREINLLVDHSFGKPVASKLEGTLKFVSTEKAPRVHRRPSHGE